MKSKGSVALFEALVFLLIASVITATIQSARVQAAKVMVGTSMGLAMDSLFADYNRNLFDRYGVLLLDGAHGQKKVDEDFLTHRIDSYLSGNLDVHRGIVFDGWNDLYGIRLQGIELGDINYVTDAGGLYWMESVVAYEKYSKTADLFGDFMDIRTDTGRGPDLLDTSAKLYECAKSIDVITRRVREIVGAIDGVIVPENGLNLKEIRHTDEFVKEFLPGMDENRLGMTLYDVRESTYQIVSRNDDPLALVDMAVEYHKMGNRNKAEQSLSGLRKLAQENYKCVQNALELIDREEDEERELAEEIEDVSQSIRENSGSYGDEVEAELQESLSSLTNYNRLTLIEILDIERTKNQLREKSEDLTHILEAIRQYKEAYDEETENALLQSIRESLLHYADSIITIHYEKLLATEKTGGNWSWLISVARFITEGALTITKPEDAVISRRKISQKDVASKSVDASLCKALEKGVPEGDLVLRRVLYDEYVADRFWCFTDRTKGVTLDYEMEYILCGHADDDKNLSDVAYRISKIRALESLVYILSDSSKRSEAEAYAILLAGWTANEPLVKIIQYMLLFLWANAEGYSDTKILLSGGQVDLIKTAANWQSTIDMIFTLHVSPDVERCKAGLDYRAFLRALLLAENDGLRSAYTMDLIENRMRLSGDSEFHFRHYIYSMQVSALYTVRGGLSTNLYTIGYSY